MGKKKGKGRSARGARKNLIYEEEQYRSAPHSFVICRGKLGKNAAELLLNFRKVMEPFTALNLKVKKQNSVRDFVSMAGLLNVSHLVVFTKTERGLYLRLARLPQGPTLTYQVLQYSLSGEVAAAQRRPLSISTLFLNPPLVVLNNLQCGDKSNPGLQLTHSMWRSLFPDINYNTVKLNSVRRTVFVDYDENKEVLSFRHYGVKLVPTSLTRPVKKMIKRDVPNLNRYANFEDYLEKAVLSESEAEEAADAQVELPQQVISRGAVVGEKVTPRMVELGPRLDLQLVKIEAELMQGEVLYHRHIQKTEEEKEQAKRRRKERQQQQALKKKQQIKARIQKKDTEETNEKPEGTETVRQNLKRKAPPSSTPPRIPSAKKNKILMERRKKLMLKKKKKSVS